ncbi:transcription elongation factor GreA [Arcobacter aquimarinus]|nr:transcription elongation factor GreA [Arcobacter aquimarinus]
MPFSKSDKLSFKSIGSSFKNSSILIPFFVLNSFLIYGKISPKNYFFVILTKNQYNSTMNKDLITKNGYEKIVKEFKDLLKEKSFWVKEKEIAAQLGDRSENAEYIAAKEQIRNCDKRLRFLDKIINNSEVIDISLIPHTKVNFGSKVVLEDLDTNEEKTFIIVGTFEVDINENKISNKSPFGRALLGKKIDDEFEFEINNRVYEYRVISIQEYNFE